MKIGITGASGVLGTILCKKLDNLNIKYSAFEGDICSKTDLEAWVHDNDWDGVIHLAAMVPTKDVANNLLKAFEVNVSGTINLMYELQKVWENEKKWFFYACTSHVYKSSNKPIDENAEISPISLYGKTKLLAENVVSEMGSLENSVFKTCIGRIFSFYHDSQQPPFLYPTIKNRLQEEDLSKEFFLYGADSIRDFLNAENVVDIIIKLMQKQSSGIFNIASGEPTKIRDFVQALTDKKLNIVTNDSKDYLVANVDKLKKELGE